MSATDAAAHTLTAGPTGTLLRPGDIGWDEARTPWVVNRPHSPAAVAVVRTTDDVAATIRAAVAAGLKILPEGSGHGASPVSLLTDTVLLRTTELDAIDVHPAEQTAWVGAGARWHQVSDAAFEHGFAVQAGSSGDVGVAGFLLSGGISWLARSKGLTVSRHRDRPLPPCFNLWPERPALSLGLAYLAQEIECFSRHVGQAHAVDHRIPTG